MKIDINSVRDYERVLATMGILKAVEDSNYTVNHSLRVGKLVKAVATDLNLDKETVFLITRAAYFHDIGKIKVPAEILFKKNKLTDDEFGIVKKHPIHGKEILESIGLIRESEIVFQHHEKLDGSGYPRGLKNDKVNGLSQILAVVDVFDALTSDRPHRKGKSIKDALLYLYSRADVEYKLFIIKSLHRIIEKQRRIRKTINI